MRGLNRKEKQNELRKLIQIHQIKLFSLLETRVRTPKMGGIYLNLCPSWCFTTNLCHALDGRIILGLDPDVFEVDIRAMSSQIIHFYITPKSTTLSFFCSFIYGMNDRRDRVTLWNQLCALTADIS